MLRTTRTAIVVLLAIGPTLLGCGSSRYLDAVTAYAQVNGEGVQALSSVPAEVVSLCHRNARAAFLRDHLPPGGGQPSSTVAWGQWYRTDHVTDTLTWEAYCEEIATAGKGFSTAVEALSSYVEALSALAGKGSYDGSDIRSLMESTGGLVTNLPSKTPAGKAIQGIAVPVSGLVAFLANAYTRRRIKEYSAQADPYVNLILGGLAAYLKASEEMVFETELAQNQALERIEVAADLYKQPVDPTKVGQFYAFAVELDADTRESRATLTGYREVVESLARAQKQLVHAGADEAGAKEVVATITDLFSKLAELRAALSRDKKD